MIELDVFEQLTTTTTAVVEPKVFDLTGPTVEEERKAKAAFKAVKEEEEDESVDDSEGSASD